MATTTTTNVGLSKPTPGTAEPFNSGALFNTDMDILDAAIGKVSNRIATVTVANTTTETVVMTHTLAAGSAIVGASYKVACWGQASVTGTPTLTVRARVGGVGGVLIASLVITAAAGVTNKGWKADFDLINVTLGVAGTWLGVLQVIDELNTVLPSAADVNMATSPQVADTTASEDVVITVQWSAASASNTTSVYAGYACRMA